MLRLRSIAEPSRPTSGVAGMIDQLVKGLLSIPDLKEKLWQKLEQELLEETPRPALHSNLMSLKQDSIRNTSSTPNNVVLLQDQ